MPFARNGWLELTTEEALEPDLPICDPHRHFGTCGPSAYHISATRSAPCAEREPANPPSHKG